MNLRRHQHRNVGAVQPAHQALFVGDRVVEGHFQCVDEVDFSLARVPAAGIERAAHDSIIPNRRRRDFEAGRQPIQQFVIRLIEAEFYVADV